MVQSIDKLQQKCHRMLYSCIADQRLFCMANP